jgi:hypothetical protein
VYIASGSPGVVNLADFNALAGNFGLSAGHPGDDDDDNDSRAWGDEL